MGYVGFSVAFAFAIASLCAGVWTALMRVLLVRGRWRRDLLDARHCARFRMGLLRTRRGGWWFWDPVENASFMPWLVGLR